MKETIPNNPLALFGTWLNMAKEQEINDPEAMALATATKEGHPSVRMVLLKDFGEDGFKFHTNAESQKGQEISENQNVALCFHWKSLRKQIRIEGIIKQATQEEADKYFASRPYARQIGAWASQQSRPLENRETLEQAIKELEKKYPKHTLVPRPEYWQGYYVIPDKIEFWWDNSDRLHDRIVFTKNTSNKWETTRLYP